MKKDYSIGLDIGTNSVGWAVISDLNKLVKRRMPVNVDGEIRKVKKNFWGVRLFEEGHTAESTRLARTTRRRIARRRNRIKYLQEIFAQEMNKQDKNFYMRLDDSFLVPEEKRGPRHPVFGTEEEEVNYHNNYPTIYHLRKALADSKEKFDLRLVYLAMAHIIKFRGHFLIEGKLSTENTSIEKTYEKFVNAYNMAFSQQEDGSLINPVKSVAGIEDIFKGKFSASKKVEKILDLYPKETKNSAFGQMLTLIVGNTANFKKVFDFPEDLKLQIPKEEYEEDLEKILETVGDDYADAFAAAADTYNAMKLVNILTGEDKNTKAKLSDSMIQRYEQHKEDLRLLKAFFRVHLDHEYYDFFKNKSKDGYAGYIDGKTSEDEFYKYTKKLIEKIDGSAYFIDKIEQENFLRKQRTYDNGVIPHQIHMNELVGIIESQEKFYPFLENEKDKILDIFKFRIPYYVGPLTINNEASRFAWMSKVKNEKIRPWNFDEVVDKEKSAKAFIERMTNWDTYLPDEKVLPQHSMVYELYTVLNELTKVNYTNDQGKTFKFSSDEKKKIIDELFKKNRKVSRKKLEDFLRNEFNIENPTVKGIEEAFLSKLGTYNDFVKLGISKKILDDENQLDSLEQIISILTIFEDRNMLRTQLAAYEEILGPAILKKMERKHYTGWGRLSRKLLTGIRDSQSKKTIMDYLWNDDDTPRNRNRNFMQLINDNDLSFKKIIETSQEKNDSHSIYDVVNSLAGSPAIKKGIIQSLKIVDEIVNIMGYSPKSVVVEMARENQTTMRGRRNSKSRLDVLKEKLTEFDSDILKNQPTDNDKLKRDALFLYYLQDGKDMYTGEPLNIGSLTHYDIDHIIPQAFIDDDSIDNRVLVRSKENRKKTDDVPEIEIVNRMEDFWTKLHKSNLISDRKFANLTKGARGGLTEEDKAGFINRQLVETRQITKHVARILDERLNQSENDHKVEVITLKSSIVSQFRRQFGIYKVREINDYHHAHDAYLNAVVSRVILDVHPKLRPEFVYGDYAKVNITKLNRATAKKEFYTNIMQFFKQKEKIVNPDTGELVWSNAWVGEIKKVLSSRQMNIVKKVEVQKGNFFRKTIYPKTAVETLYSRKSDWDTDKYGGYGYPLSSFAVVFSHTKPTRKGRILESYGLNARDKDEFDRDPTYFLKGQGFIDPIIKKIIPKYSLIEFQDSKRRLLASYRELQKGNQMVLTERFVTLLYHAKSFEKSEDSKMYIIKHKEQFDELLEVLLSFAEKTADAGKKVTQIRKIYQEANREDLLQLSNSFINLLSLTEMKAGKDYTFFDKKIGKKRYESTSSYLKGTLIHQSVTGLFESRYEIGK